MILGTHEARPVCISKPWTNESCGQSVFDGRNTFGAYAMPRGMRHFHFEKDDDWPYHLNRELGRSHHRLPVTHTQTLQHAWQPGLWFYYMRGCSDLEWEMGKTLLVRNRCHLAGILEQRAHKGLGWDAAIGRVARRLVLAGDVCSWSREYCVGRSNFTWAGANSMLVEPLKEIVYEPSKIKGQPPRRRAAGELAAALDLCARGVLAPDKDGRELQMSLWTLNTLDYVNAEVMMHELRGTPDQLDTIQIANQCSREENNRTDLADGVCTQAVEIWDVRALFNSWSTRPQDFARFPRPYASPDGSVCKMSVSTAVCLACHDSETERACRYKCSQAKHGIKSRISPQGNETPTQVTYGQVIRSEFVFKIRQVGALGKAEMWRFVWERVLRQLPRLPPPHNHTGNATTTRSVRSEAYSDGSVEPLGRADRIKWGTAIQRTSTVK